MKGLIFKFFVGGLFLVTSINGTSQNLSIARLKYNGGGDWYSSRTALPNLAKFCNENIGTSLSRKEAIVEVGSADLFKYPFVFLTGHGNVIFSDFEASQLRQYLESGGFLHICDNYGMNDYIRREMKKVFPNKEFKLVPFSHPIYQISYQFPTGLPKVHKHDDKPPQGFGIFIEGRLVCFYDFECDLGNGWEDQEVYNDPESIRLKALKMGANLIQFAFHGQ
ncbi:MAG: DUF4159 domain-containing protein [Bacteroidia bacterium]